MDRDELYELIESEVDGIFLKYQEKNNIKTGDISPYELLMLENLQNQLADLIVSINSHNV